jgi:hypothetical protein
VTSKIPEEYKPKIRALKAGQIKGWRVLKYMACPGWRTMPIEDKRRAITCGCGQHKIQDMEHIMTDCDLTKSALGTFREALLGIMRDHDEDIANMENSDNKEMIRLAFHTIPRASQATTSTRKKCKAMNKLHDDITRALK